MMCTQTGMVNTECLDSDLALTISFWILDQEMIIIAGIMEEALTEGYFHKIFLSKVLNYCRKGVHMKMKS